MMELDWPRCGPEEVLQWQCYQNELEPLILCSLMYGDTIHERIRSYVVTELSFSIPITFIVTVYV